jgi:hypothetical protein
MGKPRVPRLVKLICGLISAERDLLNRTRQILSRELGPIDSVSDVWAFDQTDYYEAEMGCDLLRQFVAFERLVSPESLAAVKHETNAIEARLAEECLALGVERPVNIDPGYVAVNKLVLATTKDASHRVSIGQRMYAEVTLRWVSGAWEVQAWTYPDFRQGHYDAYFEGLRAEIVAK